MVVKVKHVNGQMGLMVNTNPPSLEEHGDTMETRSLGGREIERVVCACLMGVGGMMNECTPCCHLYFGIQSKAQFSVKYCTSPFR